MLLLDKKIDAPQVVKDKKGCKIKNYTLHAENLSKVMNL